MEYYTLSPKKSLKDYVRFFWVLEGNARGRPFFHRSMADSCTEILFHYKGVFEEIQKNGQITGTFSSGIHSQTKNYRRFVTTDDFGIFGAYLYPYTIKRLFNLSPNELTDEMPDLNSALGQQGRELEEQMNLARSNKQRYEILSSFLEKKLLKQPEVDHPAKDAIQYVIRSKKMHPVRELAKKFNLSERQFERKFKEYSGLTPKLCLRIVRFAEACDQYGHTDKKNLSEIAHECGYYDQSHFIRDFKSFSGLEPGLYFSGRAEGIEWRQNDA